MKDLFLDPIALYVYLDSLIGSVTRHNEGCAQDLLDCDCGAETDGGDLVEACFEELRRLRGPTIRVCEHKNTPLDCHLCEEGEWEGP